MILTSYTHKGHQLNMEKLNAAVIITVGMVLLANPVAPYPGGAAPSACSSLTPGHGSQSTAASPYTLTIGAVKYQAGSTITVTVSGASFMGILMQVRQVGSNSDTAYGSWSNLPANTRLLQCANAGDSVTHQNTNTKQNAVFTWTAPQGVTVDLQFIATVAQEKTVWWRRLTSATLTYTNATITTMAPGSTTDSMATCIGPTGCFVVMATLVALLILRLY